MSKPRALNSDITTADPSNPTTPPPPGTDAPSAEDAAGWVAEEAENPARPALLCESCGYGLRGLRLAEVCPECGLPISDSLPLHRTGPAWQARMTAGHWLEAARGVLGGPKRFFRGMRLDGPNLPARFFLLSIALIVGVGWGVFTAVGHDKPILLSWVVGMAAAKTVLIMTYIESLGVTFFSRRRGWRVPFRLAERLTCYASVGWILAAVVLAVLSLVETSGVFEAWARKFLGRWNPEYRLLLGVVAFGAAVMGFELLVWTGVRQVRFSNVAVTKVDARP
ncbi:MAG: hypothetical protein AAF333_08480 [Planctomycetota bacterium]